MARIYIQVVFRKAYSSCDIQICPYVRGKDFVESNCVTVVRAELCWDCAVFFDATIQFAMSNTWYRACRFWEIWRMINMSASDRKTNSAQPSIFSRLSGHVILSNIWYLREKIVTDDGAVLRSCSCSCWDPGAGASSWYWAFSRGYKLWEYCNAEAEHTVQTWSRTQDIGSTSGFRVSCSD